MGHTEENKVKIIDVIDSSMRFLVHIAENVSKSFISGDHSATFSYILSHLNVKNRIMRKCYQFYRCAPLNIAQSVPLGGDVHCTPFLSLFFVFLVEITYLASFHRYFNSKTSKMAFLALSG